MQSKKSERVDITPGPRGLLLQLQIILALGAAPMDVSLRFEE